MDPLLRPNAEPIPGYRLLERLGRGGYGEVWKVEAPGGMHKAIKFVFGNLDSAGDDGRAAEQEFKSLNRVKTIRHPFLLSLERMEVIEGQLVIVMELADRNLADRYAECQAGGLVGIPRAELLGYLDEAAEALDLMNIHHQIQHLDIKPQNLFLVHQHVKVADFGLAKDMEGAKAVLTGGMTPTYAPPETFEGWVSRQSDQYSLAIVYMEMLTGRRPFPGPSTRQLILQHMSAVPDLSPLRSPDREAVARALAKNPEDRFPTCKDFVRAVRGEVPGGVTPYPGAETPSKFGPASGDTSVPKKAATVKAAPEQPTDKPTPEPKSGDARKGLPALVTRGGKALSSGAHPTLRTPLAAAKGAPAEAGKSRAPVERTGDGVLFPALVIGVGGMGLAVIKALRGLILDQFRRPTLPHLRWLSVDTDETAAAAAVAPASPVALSPDEVVLTRLRRPTHYLTRDGLPPVEAWLPPGELYRMPRTPSTDGVRGFGRLALCDHYHAVVQRIRGALESFVRPDAIEEAQRATGLGLRSSFPRVYVATSLSGGTGSGMFLDLTFLVRRELTRLGFGAPRVVGLLGVPAYTADGREARGLANARAALTELNHYSQPGASYKAQFDTREPALVDQGAPFRRCALVRLASRPDRGDQAGDIAAHLAYGDLLTSIGRTAHPDDEPAPAGSLSLVGVRRLSWPRAHVLRTAGWLLAKQTLQSWLERNPVAPAAVSAAVSAHWGERDLDPGDVWAALEAHVNASPAGPPDRRINAILSAPPKGGTTDGPTVLKDAFCRLLEYLGNPGADEADQPGEVARALGPKVKELTAQADSKVTTAVVSLMEQPGLRLAGAEEAIAVLHARLQEKLTAADRHLLVAQDQAARDLAAVQPYVLPASGSGPGRAATAAGFREGMTLLTQWALSRANSVLARACANVFRALVDNLPEYVRELKSIQTQLGNYIHQLDEAAPPPLPKVSITRTIFPDEARSASDAATRLLGALAPKDRREFENGLQARIRHECRGVVNACTRVRETGAAFKSLVVDQAIKFLERRVAVMSASAALEIHCPDPAALAEQVRELFTSAAPVPLGPEPAPPPTVAVLGVPDDDSAERLCQTVRKFFPDLTFRTSRTGDDVFILQEASGIAPANLPHLTGRLPAPSAADSRPIENAHARADVCWVPIGAD